MHASRNIFSFCLILIFFIQLLPSTGAPIAKDESDEPDESERRSKLVAFLLSFFAGGFGADWFYLSRGSVNYIIVGIVKLIMISQAGICCCTVSLGCCSIKEKMKNICWPCGCLVSLGVFIWWLVDWARILTNNFDDGNGWKLEDDF